MNKIRLLLPCLLLFSCMPNENSYNENLAKSYGADEYGMKKYIIAFLNEGPNRDQEKSVRDSLQRAHMDNINRLAAEGKLVLAGPFLSEGPLKGIYIFNVSSIEEAKALTETDPAVQAGSLVLELKEWYGSAALVGLNKAHESIAKKNH